MQAIYDDVIQIKRAGDALRLIATIYLLLLLRDSKKSTGFSGKSQVLFAIVYTARYFGKYVGDVLVLNGFEIVLRVTLVCASYFIVYLIYYKFEHHSSREQDKFRIGCLIVASGVLACLYNPGFSNNVFDCEELRMYGIPFVEIGWAFSYYLEAVAIWPQLIMQRIRKNRQKQDFADVYLKFMGISRLMYAIYSIYERKHDVISDVSGIVQLYTYLAYFLSQIAFNRKSDQIIIINLNNDT